MDATDTDATHELAAALRRERAAQARAMTEKQRLEAGGELFDYACEIAKAGIRAQHPQASEADVMAILRARLAARERREARRQQGRPDECE